MDPKTRRLVSLRGCDHRTEALGWLPIAVSDRYAPRVVADRRRVGLTLRLDHPVHRFTNCFQRVGGDLEGIRYSPKSSTSGFRVYALRSQHEPVVVLHGFSSKELMRVRVATPSGTCFLCRVFTQRLIELGRTKQDILQPIPHRCRTQCLRAHRVVGVQRTHESTFTALRLRSSRVAPSFPFHSFHPLTVRPSSAIRAALGDLNR